jgi:Ca2+-binding EF-hand superfamily protein
MKTTYFTLIVTDSTQSNPSSPSKPAGLFSQRASPFRRPESPLGRSPSTVRASTPQQDAPKHGGSPLKQSAPMSSATSYAESPIRPLNISRNNTPGLTQQPTSPTSTSRPLTTPATDRSWIKSPQDPNVHASKSPIPFSLPQATSKQPASSTPFNTRPAASLSTTNSKDPFSSLPPQTLHTMRESFSVLDRSNSGNISTSDISHALSDLGLSSDPATLSTYFPSGSSQNNLNLAGYLSTLTRDFLRLSRREELLAAFSAFDTDDSGQIDVAELREALLTTPMLPEDSQDGARALSAQDINAAMDGFVGRRTLQKGQIHAASGGGLAGRNGKGGDVFRYGDFATSVWGAGNAGGRGDQGVAG